MDKKERVICLINDELFRIEKNRFPRMYTCDVVEVLKTIKETLNEKPVFDKDCNYKGKKISEMNECELREALYNVITFSVDNLRSQLKGFSAQVEIVSGGKKL
jgi:hypothetical protein